MTLYISLFPFRLAALYRCFPPLLRSLGLEVEYFYSSMILFYIFFCVGQIWFCQSLLECLYGALSFLCVCCLKVLTLYIHVFCTVLVFLFETPAGALPIQIEE